MCSISCIDAGIDFAKVLREWYCIQSRAVTIHITQETRHLAVHGLQDNTYPKTTNEIPNIILCHVLVS